MANKLKYKTYEKLVRLFNFDPTDYDMWNELLSLYDSDAIDEAVQRLILKKSKAPTVAEVAALAEEIEVKTRTEKKEIKKSQEEKTQEREKLFEEGVRALEKNYYLVFRKSPYGYISYSWEHETCVNNNKNLKSFNLKNPYTEESILAFFGGTSKKSETFLKF